MAVRVNLAPKPFLDAVARDEVTIPTVSPSTYPLPVLEIVTVATLPKESIVKVASPPVPLPVKEES